METLSDVTLTCDDGVQIYAHKIILATASSVFLSKFNDNVENGQKNNIFINAMESNILKSIVTCAYTFKLDIEKDNIEKLLKAAEYLDFNHAKDLCYSYIKKCLNVENCIHFMECAKPLSQKGLYTYCFLYFLNNFEKIVENESLLKCLYPMDFDDVLEIISNDNLVVKSEEKIFDFIVGWINYDLNNRNQYFPVLIKYLRLPLISASGHKRICNESLLETHKDCLMDIMRKIICENDDAKIQKNTVRIPNSYQPNIIFAIKDRSTDDGSCVMYMDLRCEEDLCWKSCDNSFLCPRRDATLVVSESGILLAIGNDSEVSKNWVDELDLTSTSKKWVSTSPMLTFRTQFAVCTQGNYIYVVGGEDIKGKPLSSIEYYDTCSKIWHEIKEPMPIPRTQCGAIINDCCLYVFFGHVEDLDRRVDCYNINKKYWTQLDPMPHSIQYPLCVTNRRNKIVSYHLVDETNGIYKGFFYSNLHDLILHKQEEEEEPNWCSLCVVKENDVLLLSDSYKRYISKKNKWKKVNLSNKLSTMNGYIICLNDVFLKTYDIHL
ncbi:kelch-like protein diablo isoform X2 [Adelges cooleyi]|nr:kelch-like protein diablo isoform X2 [Adelges cooleyi]